MALSQHPEQLLLAEIQVLLAEKRTYFALLRTSIAIATVPFSAIVFLVATAEYHNIFNYPWISSVIVVLLLLVSANGLKLNFQSRSKINQIEKLIKTIEKENKRIAEIIV